MAAPIHFTNILLVQHYYFTIKLFTGPKTFFCTGDGAFEEYDPSRPDGESTAIELWTDSAKAHMSSARTAQEAPKVSTATHPDFEPSVRRDARHVPLAVQMQDVDIKADFTSELDRSREKAWKWIEGHATNLSGDKGDVLRGLQVRVTKAGLDA